MFDYVIVEAELPKSAPGWIEGKFQTKDTPRQFMETYVITADGKLIHKAQEYEEVPKEERPYPDEDGLFALVGSLRSAPVGDVQIMFHGDLHLIASNRDWSKFWRCRARFTHGKLEEIVHVENPSLNFHKK